MSSKIISSSMIRISHENVKTVLTEERLSFRARFGRDGRDNHRFTELSGCRFNFKGYNYYVAHYYLENSLFVDQKPLY